nr:uncharacterized protein LOC108005992 isoform X2 [Drosophila suzukii]
MPKTKGSLSRVRKRKFQGNQFSGEASADHVSSSAKKLKDMGFDDIEIDASTSYVICNFLMVFNALSEFLVCKSCSGAVKFGRTAGPGVGFKLIVNCSCEKRQILSSPMSQNVYEINRRLLFAFRVFGCGLQTVKTFCSLLDIKHSFSNSQYYNFLDNLNAASKVVFDIVRRKAAKEEIGANSAAGNEPTHLSVSGDGSWKKRGFSSLFGLVSLIGTPEYEDHVDDCAANHSESAGKMEVDGVREMFENSESLLGVKYKYYIGDGDTKTFKALADMNPYDDCPVAKKECVGHVQKRMGSRLRKLKKDTKGLGGKGAGKLTDKLITELTLFYGLAIRGNADSSSRMKDAIWATYYHKCSTDDQPQHHLCPEGSESWCNWQVAKAEGKLETFKHKPPLAEIVADAIKPIYEALSNPDLERCVGANTQNSNESFNAIVWRMAPKHLHCGSHVIEICTYIAA